MEEKSVGRSFLILSLAGILVKILSAAYVPLLNAIIGQDGIGIYNASYSYFVFILAITSLGAQPAVAKVVSELRAQGHHEDALRAMKIARNYLAIIGAIITIIFISLAGVIASGTKWSEAALSLSLIFAYVFMQISVEWGSAGGTVGTTIGAIAALIFILIMYDKLDYEGKAEIENEFEKNISKKKILRKLLFYGVPIIMVAGLQNAGGLVDTINVKSRLLAAGFSKEESTRLFGVLGFYNTLLNVPFALVTALSAAIFPKIIQAYTQKNRKELKAQMSYSFKITYLITIPAAVGLSMLSKDVYLMLFNTTSGYELLKYGSVVLVFMSISAIQNIILQGINKVYLVLSTAFLSIMLKFSINYFLVAIKDINILGAIFASFFAFLVPVIINHKRLKRIFKMKIRIFKLAVIPSLSAAFMALGIFIFRIPIDRIVNIIGGGRLVTCFIVLILVAIGGLIYLIALILLGGIKKRDLDMISPKLFTLLPRFLRKNL